MVINYNTWAMSTSLHQFILVLMGKDSKCNFMSVAVSAPNNIVTAA